MIFSALRLALRELWANKLRTFLTCTGMIIGVSAVIALLTIGAGVSASINREFASIGQNLVWIWPGGEQQRGPQRDVKRFTWRDLDLVRRTVPGVIRIAPSVGAGHSVKFGNLDANTTIIGTTPDYFDIRLWTFASGRAFSEAESDAGRMVCAIGQTLRAKLFGNSDPVGQRVRIDGIACEIVGLMNPKGAGTFGQDEDDRIILPLIVPALITSAIFSFYWTWEDFLTPLVYLNAPKLYTVSLALRSFADPSGQTDWGAIFAMSALSLVPVFVIFVLFQRYLVQGISTTGLKG